MIDEKSILVTIGIPFYKDVDTLAYAIRSVQRQTWKNFELILLDDGGNDGSLDVAKSFLLDERIRIISDGNNRGLPSRLNELIDLARGKYFARMDADDIMHPDRIEEQVTYLEEHPDIDVLGTGAYSIDVNNNVLGEKNKKPQNFTYRDLFEQTAVMHPTVMAKVSWYKNNKYCTEDWAIRVEDFELWCRTWDWSKFANLDKKLMYYREGNSIRKSLDNQILSYEHKKIIVDKYAYKYLNKSEIYSILLKNEIKKYIWITINKLGLINVFSGYIYGKRFMKLAADTQMKAQFILDDIIKWGELCGKKTLY